MEYRKNTNVILYFDVSSLHSWITFESLVRYKCIGAINLNIQFVFLNGTSDPIDNKLFDQFNSTEEDGVISDNVNEKAEFFGSQKMTHSNFNILRFLTAVSLLNNNHLIDIVSQIWNNIRDTNKNVYSYSGLKNIAAEVGITDSNFTDIMKMSKSDEVMTLLKNNTNEAINKNILSEPRITFNNFHRKEISIFGNSGLEKTLRLIHKEYINKCQTSKL
uniref:DSBA domain-containing protein n=1 Tax=Rhabditophanes sp. KR3021 TaxID=114890 RepID=A0AC35U2I8_9BILA